MDKEATGSEEPRYVRWRTGRIGCLLPVVLAGALLFAWLAAAEGPVELGRGHGEGAAAIRLIGSIRIGGVNVGLLMIALLCVFELGRMGWRWADEVAVAGTEAGLRFHPTLLRKPIAWGEIREVRFATARRQWADVPSLLIVPRRGRSFTVAGIGNEERAAQRFAALASRLATAGKGQ